MATMYVTEFADAGGGSHAPLQIPKYPALASYSFAITGSSTTSGRKFGPNTKYIWATPDVICSFNVDTAPTAVTTANRLAADKDLFMAVTPGDTIAVITNT